MIVEFVGMPGSGKSYLAKHLASLLGQDVLLVDHETKEKLRFSSILKLVFMLLPLCLLFQLYLSSKPKEKLSLMRFFKTLKFKLFETKREIITLRDQGAIQWLWSSLMFATEFSKPLVERLLKTDLFKVDLVVFVKVREEVVLSRLKSREKNFSRLEFLAEPDLSLNIKREAGKLDDLCAAYQGAGLSEVIILENNDNIDVDLSPLVQKIMQLREQK